MATGTIRNRAPLPTIGCRSVRGHIDNFTILGDFGGQRFNFTPMEMTPKDTEMILASIRTVLDGIGSFCGPDDGDGGNIYEEALARVKEYERNQGTALASKAFIERFAATVARLINEQGSQKDQKMMEECKAALAQYSEEEIEKIKKEVAADLFSWREQEPEALTNGVVMHSTSTPLIPPEIVKRFGLRFVRNLD